MNANSKEKPEEIWFAYNERSYKGDFPNFYNTLDYNWVNELEQNYSSILNETASFIKQHELEFTPYFNETLVSKENAWKTILFKFWGEDIRLMNELPILNSLLSKVPNLTSIALSKLEPNTEINWHPGDSNAFIRCHYPLIVPSGLPNCGFQVNDETRAWIKGKLLMFCDAHQHRAFNYTNEDRVLLIFDFLRPDFLENKKDIIASIQSELWIQKIKGNNFLIRWLPNFIIKLLRENKKSRLLSKTKN